MVLLNTAANVYAGSSAALKVYAGSTLIWEEAGEPPPSNPNTTFWYSFEGGTVGNDITTTDIGTGTPWSSVSVPNPDFSSGAKTGSICASVAPASPANTSIMQWNGTGNAQRAHGFWFKPAASPAGDTRITDIRDTSSSGTAGGVLYRIDRTLRLMVGTSGVSAATSPALTLASWYWVCLTWDVTNLQAKLIVHDSTGSSFYESGFATIPATYPTPATARFGKVTTNGDIGATLFDDIQFNVGSAAPLSPWS